MGHSDGMKLRTWRLRQKLTQAKLADRMGVAHHTIMRYEAGAKPRKEIRDWIEFVTDGRVGRRDWS